MHDFQEHLSICLFIYIILSLLLEGGMLDLIVQIPDHCISFYFT